MNSRIATATEQQSNMAQVLDNSVANMTNSSYQAASVSRSTVDDACTIKSLAAESQSLIKRFHVSNEQIIAESREHEQALFKWDESYSLGIPEIDRQHKILIELINELNKTVSHNRGEFLTQRVLQGIIDYTTSHFAYEEEMLERQSYEKLDEHKEKHTQLLEQLVGFQIRLKEDEEVAVELIGFLIDWFSRHIKREDKDYSTSLAKKNSSQVAAGSPAPEAGEIDLF